MREFIFIFIGLLNDLINMLDRCVFVYGAVVVSLLDLLVPMVVLSMLIGLFWKGAKG